MDLILKYFPELLPSQVARYETLLSTLPRLNEKVNVISRKDIDSLEEKHVLHSLSLAKKFSFVPDTQVMDVGTGGGFPGIPLAIMYPDTSFILVDSIGKKIKLVQELCSLLDLSNVLPLNRRMEDVDMQADFVVSRAVAAFPSLHEWTRKIISPGHRASMPNGLISLKGGDLSDELRPFRNRVKLFPLNEWFEEAFFSTKMIVYLKK